LGVEALRRVSGRDVAAKASWVLDPVVKAITGLETGFKKYPPTKLGSPDPHLPPKL
jgi:hypothetical protein